VQEFGLSFRPRLWSFIPLRNSPKAFWMDKMKLLLIADLHFHIDRFRWLIKQAPNYDLVCIVGDLLDMFIARRKKNQSGWIEV
jgi:predicted MPP superfamily phosphohydrolase